MSISGVKMSEDNWASAEKRLNVWLQRARREQHSHYEAAKFFQKAHYLIAVPIILITASLGTAAFATITAKVDGTAKAWFGGLSMFAAVLSALQAHLKFSEKSERHKGLGAKYGSIRREIESALSVPPADRGAQKDVLDGIRAKFDAISNDGDIVSRRIFERTQARLERKDQLAASDSGAGT